MRAVLTRRAVPALIKQNAPGSPNSWLCAAPAEEHRHVNTAERVDRQAELAALQDAFMAGTYEPEPLTAKVPVLMHEGRTMVESLLVAAYVARTFGGDVDYASATEQYAGALFAAQFNALTPLYMQALKAKNAACLLYTSPSPRDRG